MEVKNALASARPVINGKPEIGQPGSVSDVSCCGQDIGKDSGILGTGHILNVLLRNNQYMGWGLGLDVFKRIDLVILKDSFSGDLSGDNFTK